MDKIAWILGDISIRWSSVVMVMAVLTGILFFLAAAARGNRKVTSAALALPMAILLSLLFGRLLHWYFFARCGGRLCSDGSLCRMPVHSIDPESDAA